ncbi:branched-chain-amino-acid transaminase [Stappia sp.]|uniref:branched-chain-amino-acid transaminase n=1 Tax=Stappia sp. TaxID=1870903 RepID=UPI0032D8FE03
MTTAERPASPTQAHPETHARPDAILSAQARPAPSSAGLPERVGTVWMDGMFRSGSEAATSILTHSLHYGTAVFEGLRVYEGTCFASRPHYERLQASARALGYVVPADVDTLVAATDELIAANGIREGYVRAICWLGSDSLGLMAGDLTVHVAIAMWEWPQVHALDGEDAGIRLHLSQARRPDAHTLPPQAKAAGGYLIGTMAYHAAKRHGCDDAILLDQEGLLAESSSANLFLVRDGVLLTPIADRFLNGLTRQTVLHLAADLGVELYERRLGVEALASADEIFLAGTAVEILPVTAVDGTQLSVGPVTRRLRAAYAQCVRAGPAAVPPIGPPITPSMASPAQAS